MYVQIRYTTYGIFARYFYEFAPFEKDKEKNFFFLFADDDLPKPSNYVPNDHALR